MLKPCVRYPPHHWAVAACVCGCVCVCVKATGNELFKVRRFNDAVAAYTAAIASVTAALGEVTMIVPGEEDVVT